MGRFRDVNIRQSFKVDYVTDAVPNASKEFSFRNIKSLFYPRPLAQACPPIQSNQSVVTAARCQAVNIPISFSTVKWSTYGENPDYCFGSISAYEYQLPSGWSIGPAVSTGNNWIAGNNSVTVTSDLATGNGSAILIRPTNSCATGLANGESPVQILVSRPAPALSITGQDYLCNANDQTTLTLNGLPTGATVVWGVSLPNQLQPVGCTTCPTITLEKIGSASTTATATATVTHCSFTYTISKTIKLGAPAGIGIVSYDNLNPNSTYTCFQVLANNSISVFAYTGTLTVGTTGSTNTASWGLTPGTSDNGWSYTASGGTVTVNTKQSNTGFSLRYTASNDCGSSFKDYGFTSGTCIEAVERIAMATPTAYTLYPNPSKGIFTITANQSNKATTVKEVVIKNKVGVTVRQVKGNSFQKVQSVNIQPLPAGLYFVYIFDGKNWVVERMIKE